jgi:hypothetical protein
MSVSSNSSDYDTQIVAVRPLIVQQGGNPPSTAVIRAAAYDGKFPCMKVAGRLMVHSADLPTIARLYGVMQPAAA